MTPKRIQLRRTKGWRLPANTVVVSRPTRWGNPFRIGAGTTRAQAVARFRRMFEAHGGYAGNGPKIPSDEVRRELKGKNLACWCPLDEPCHADLLLEFANRPARRRPARAR